MKIRKVCVILCCLVLLTSMVAMACAPGQTTPTTTTPAVPEPMPTTKVPVAATPPVEKPVYGGTLTLVLAANILRFTSLGQAFMGDTFLLTNQTVLDGDWSRGPAGTKEFEWSKGNYGSWDSLTGLLVDKWEMPEPGTVIWKIRQGVRFSLDPNNRASRLVNGRELNANDVAKNLELFRTVPGSAPTFGGFRFSTNIALDKWTVQTKIAPEITDDLRTTFMYMPLVAPELYEQKYDLNDWRNAVGTGAFILTDFVDGSSATLSRNPNYWETDPVGLGKGNRLPYIDRVSFLIIPDDSTRLAAFRTGKVDILHNVSWEDAAVLSRNPELISKKFYGDSGNVIAMRTDKADLPFKDKRVRRALMMATDFETIKNTWGGREAQILTFPIHYAREEAPAFLGLDDPEMPVSVKELYIYNPAQARQLLAEAGYPTGFKTRVVCQNFPSSIDYLSIIKEHWAKVGIELTIDPREPGAFTSIRGDRTHAEMIHMGGSPNANMFLASAIDGVTRAGNLSYVDDPIVKQAKSRWSPITLSDPVGAMRIHKELMKYVLDQAWAIPGVNPIMHHMWWPWIKNYGGEFTLGRTWRAYTKYIWMDRDLKKAKGY